MSQNILVDLSNALADGAERAGKATVLVDARRRMPASGIAYAADLILTADHVIERQEGITAILPDGTDVAASVIGRDATTDIALLKVERSMAQVAEPATPPARLGQIVLMLGRPSKNGLEASLGTVSALGGPVPNGHGGVLEEYIRTDGIPYPGFSGGPLVAADGSVLGLNTSGLGNRAAITIPTRLAWGIAASLAQHGRVRRGYLGVRSQTVQIPGATQASLKRNQVSGLLIVDVERDSPASRGGFMVGDILVAVAGVPVLLQDELFTRLRGDVVGRATPIEVLRGGVSQTLDIVIGEK
jgi:S1-C subfamily serine protease